MILHSEELIKKYTDGGFWDQSTIMDLFIANCEAHPEREAIIDPPNRPDLVGTPACRLTWGETKAAVDAVASGLVGMGFGKDDVLVAQLPNTWELAVLYLATCKAGGVLSALPVQWRRNDLGHVKTLTKSRFYVSAGSFHGFDFREMAQGLGFEQCMDLPELTEMARSTPANEVDVALTGNDIFTLCWTSGTELEPKGCPLSHNNWKFLIGQAFSRKSSGLMDGDRVLCVAPLVNMTAVGVSLIPWLKCGGTFVLHHPIDMKVLIQQLVTEGISFTLLVPAMLNMLLKLPNVDDMDLSNIRTIATGSAPPSAWSISEFKRRWNIEVINIWGQNEGTAIVSGALDVPNVDKMVDHFPWWGKGDIKWPSGAHGIDIKILNESDEEVSEPGQVGELCYRSPSVFPGYFGRPDITEKSFTADGFFRTGDLFIVKDDSHVGFYDRKKDMVIRGGFNISSAEVENAVLGFAGVKEVAVVPVPDEVMGEKVCICVVPMDPDAPPSLQEINEFLKEEGMSVYKLPEKMKLVDAIPRNPVGKILKRELREA